MSFLTLGLANSILESMLYFSTGIEIRYLYICWCCTFLLTISSLFLLDLFFDSLKASTSFVPDIFSLSLSHIPANHPQARDSPNYSSWWYFLKLLCPLPQFYSSCVLMNTKPSFWFSFLHLWLIPSFLHFCDLFSSCRGIFLPWKKFQNVWVSSSP